MKLSGAYDEVVEKLRISEQTVAEIDDVAADLSRVLETINQIDGGTKSVIVEHLPNDMGAEYDSDTVVNALQVLERYDLVTLDGNTWNVTG